MKHSAEINFTYQGFLIATPILIVVDSMHGQLQLCHALLLTSLSQLCFLSQCELRVQTSLPFARAEAHTTRLTSPGPLDVMAMEVDGIALRADPED